MLVMSPLSFISFYLIQFPQDIYDCHHCCIPDSSAVGGTPSYGAVIGGSGLGDIGISKGSHVTSNLRSLLAMKRSKRLSNRSHCSGLISNMKEVLPRRILKIINPCSRPFDVFQVTSCYGYLRYHSEDRCTSMLNVKATP